MKLHYVWYRRQSRFLHFTTIYNNWDWNAVLRAKAIFKIRPVWHPLGDANDTVNKSITWRYQWHHIPDVLTDIYLEMPMTPQARRAPAFPVVLLSSWPPFPKSSTSAWICGQERQISPDYHHKYYTGPGSITSQQCRDQFRCAPSQWETSSQCNDISHWLDAYLEWSPR